METIEPFHTFEDEFKHSVPLRNGIDIQQLTREAGGGGGGGVEFEIDYDTLRETPGYSQPPLDQEELLKNLTVDCLADTNQDSDSDDNVSPFGRMGVQMVELTEDGGVLKKVIRPGIGKCVPEGAVVRVHYNGYLEYCDEPYDSSRLRNTQLQFKLGHGEVIPGWDLAVASMTKGELSKFLVKPEYAYGKVGCPPRIPPSATIMFEIEVLSFVDSTAVDQFQSYSKEEKEKISIDQLLEVANSEREVGNDLFEQKVFWKASSKYGKAVRLLENARLKSDEEEEKWKVVLVKLLLNQSLCSLRMRKSRLAISQCRRVLELEAKNVKAHFRIGQAHIQLSEFDRSKEYLVKAAKLCPGNSEIRQELVKLDKAVRQFHSMEKSMMKKMFELKPATETSEGAAGNGGTASTQPPQQQQQQRRRKGAKSCADLAKIKEVLVEKLSTLAETDSMREMVLPATLDPEEVACTEEVAASLGLFTETRSNGCLRIYKPGFSQDDIPPQFQ